MQPERSDQLADVTFPARPDRQAVTAHRQLAFTTSPQPERTTSLAAPVFPDRLPHPYDAPQRRLGGPETSLQPERATPLAEVTYPGRLPRVPVTQHPFQFVHIERTLPSSEVSYPDRVNRAAFLVGAHLHAAAPDQGPGDLGWVPAYLPLPARVMSRSYEQPTAPLVDDSAQVVQVDLVRYPDFVRHPLLASRQSDFGPATPRFDADQVPVSAYSIYPDQLATAWFHVTGQRYVAYVRRVIVQGRPAIVVLVQTVPSSTLEYGVSATLEYGVYATVVQPEAVVTMTQSSPVSVVTQPPLVVVFTRVEATCDAIAEVLMTQLTMVRGDTLEFDIQIFRSDGVTPYDLTDATVWSTIKRQLSDADADAVSQVDSTGSSTPAGGEITITSAALGTVTVRHSALATTDFEAAAVEMFYDVQIKDSDARVFTVQRGTVLVDVDVTRRTT